jgi:hypothetical protein
MVDILSGSCQARSCDVEHNVPYRQREPSGEPFERWLVLDVVDGNRVVLRGAHQHISLLGGRLRGEETVSG